MSVPSSNAVRYWDEQNSIHQFTPCNYLLNYAALKLTVKGSWQAYAIQLGSYGANLADTVARMAAIPFMKIAAPIQRIVADTINGKLLLAACKVLVLPVPLLFNGILTITGELTYALVFLVHLSGLTTLWAVYYGEDAGKGYFNERIKTAELAEYSFDGQIRRVLANEFSKYQATHPDEVAQITTFFNQYGLLKMPEKTHTLLDFLAYLPKPTSAELQ